MNNAFYQGQKAYHAGYYEDANPYPSYSNDFKNWLSGWEFEFKKNYHDEDGAF